MSGSILAITRAPSSSLARCELTHLEREPIDVERARQEHGVYERALAELGCELLQLVERPELPDAVFVEDTAVVLPEVAVLARPGAPSRRAELPSIAAALAPFRELCALEAPARLDGGDVLRLGDVLFVGSSSRTNRAGFEQLSALVTPFGYRLRSVEVSGCLHLKTAVTGLDAESVLLDPRLVDAGVFSAYRSVEVDPREALAANALRVGTAVIYAEHFPRTAERMRNDGFSVRLVPAAELAKAEAGVTCCSLLVER